MQFAPFLAAATVIVYAGAIVVTFVFVIMLAQQSGATVYDQRSRQPRDWQRLRRSPCWRSSSALLQSADDQVADRPAMRQLASSRSMPTEPGIRSRG